MPTTTLPVRVTSPLPDSQEVLLHWMSGHEELGRLFHYDLELYCDKEVPFKSLLGQPLTVSLNKQGGERHFNGIVTRFAAVGSAQRYFVYRVVLSPKLWITERVKDCRVFQNVTVPEIVKQLLGDYAIKFNDRLQQKYRKIDYVCQYRESAFDFMSRLMEKEGIYYYFKHSVSAHEMVLADGIGSHDVASGYDKLRVWDEGEADTQGDHLTDWRESRQLQSTRVVLQDHDFRLQRTADILAQKIAPADCDIEDWEIFDYRGGYLVAENKDEAVADDTRTAGEHYASVDVDLQRLKAQRIDGEGEVRGLETGALFTIDDDEIADTQLLVVTTQHQIRNVELQSDGGLSASGDIADVSFSAIDSKRQFRPDPITPKPVAAGPDTALVVGARGQEIWTDKHGRVRIRFHWEREGEDDDSSTCWVRVSQAWAGSQWGAQFIPRIGHEVVVQYLGGDPDRPLITGSVYNKDNPPPYAPDKTPTQSGIKTRSTLGGGPSNFNEIRFEDKKGAEELHVQAERDQSTYVKRNQSITVDGDRSVTVGGNETITVKGTRTSTITKKETQNFNDDREMTVVKKNTETVNGGRDVTIEKGDSLIVMASDKTDTIHGTYAITADTAFQLTQGPNSVVVKNAVTVESVGDIVLKNTGCEIGAEKTGSLVIEALQSIQLKCGAASIVLSMDGSIELKGVTGISASAGPAELMLMPASSSLKGPMVDVTGMSAVAVQAPIVKVG